MPAAGDPIYASDFPYLVATFSSTVSATATGTTETAVVTLPSATYLAGSAYRLKVTGGIISSSGTNEGFWRVRKTSASGTQLLEWPRNQYASTTLAHDIGLSEKYFIVGGTDVTTVLVLTIQATAGTIQHAAGAFYPRGVDIHYAGTSALWPNAVVLS